MFYSRAPEGAILLKVKLIDFYYIK